MTILEAINWIDEHKPNTYSQEDKIKWLNDLDHNVYNTICQYESEYEPYWQRYTPQTDPNQEMLIGDPYDSIYVHWLESRIDYYNGEYAKFNNTNAVFQADLREWEKYWNRNHLPKGRIIRYF